MSGLTANIQLPYKPLPKQAEAHSLSCKFRGYGGAWGNGKTSWGCFETFVTLHEYPGTLSIVARKTRPELKSTTWDMLMNGDPGQPNGWHGIPKETIKLYNRSDLYVELNCGSRIHGLPLDDPKKIENYNLGHFWIDQCEEVEEDIFLKFHGRLRQRIGPREGLITYNPNGHNWIWKRFIDPERREKWRQIYQTIEATTYDNPNLPEDYFEQFDGLPDAWLQRFVMGSHEVFVGQIFTDFEPEVHVIQPFLIPSTWERWMCQDPGIRHEGAASWIARDFEGNVYYYREILQAGQPVQWWAENIFATEAQDDWGGPNEHIYRRLIGPEAKQRSQESGKSVQTRFQEFGLSFDTADNEPGSRISVITEYLRPKSGHSHPWTGQAPAPRLYMFSDCSKLREYLPQYRWKPQRTNFTEEAAAEAPRKRDDHNIDNLGHLLLVMDELPAIPPHRVGAMSDAEFLEHHFRQAYENATTRPMAPGGRRTSPRQGSTEDQAWANEIEEEVYTDAVS